MSAGCCHHDSKVSNYSLYLTLPHGAGILLPYVEDSRKNNAHFHINHKVKMPQEFQTLKVSYTKRIISPNYP